MDLLTDHLAEARSAYRRGDWSASHAGFARADGVGPLSLDDVGAFATAAWRVGHASEAVRLSERVYGRLVRADPAAAAMAALDVALLWLTRGDANVCRIWMDRSRGLLAGAAVGPTHGYLSYLEAALATRTRDGHQAVGLAVRDVEALHDAAVDALSSIVEALAAYDGGRLEDGHALVERAISAVEAGEVRLEWAGDVYALLLHLGRTVADPPRRTRWTASMRRWCGAHDAPLYQRVLRVHLTSSEPELLTESEALEGVHRLAAAEGFHRLGEMRRQRGDADGAAAAFATARRLGVG